jgi:phosphoglycolate phosphatase-like HAD superfamily hydrolase
MGAARPMQRGSDMAVRYVIFDLDDTLVHSDAVRRAFCEVAAGHGIGAAAVNATCDALPGRPALNVFQAVGLSRDDAADAAIAFLACLERWNAVAEAVSYPDADRTLRIARERAAKLFLSTGSPEHRARRVLADHGWRVFDLVLGGGDAHAKGPEHFHAMSRHLRGWRRWTREAATVGDSPADMRLAAGQGVPVRIGVDRGGDARALRAHGATHVVERLADVVPILAAA